MTKLEIGEFGIGVSYAPGQEFQDTLIAAERAGFPTIWLAGGPLQGANTLDPIREALDTTEEVKVVSGILSVDVFDSARVAAFYEEVEARHPGRFILGLGGAHGGKPVTTLTKYLDELGDTAPQHRTVLAAMGPKMLDLAAQRTGGAYPFLVTPDYTVQAKARLGRDRTLAIEQLVDLDPDREAGLQRVRDILRFMTGVGGYRASLLRQGFTENDIDELADSVLDGVAAIGDVDAVVERVKAHRRSGADHVTVGGNIPVERFGDVAAALS